MKPFFAAALLLAALLLVAEHACAAQGEQPLSMAEMESMWRAGKTLPESVFERFKNNYGRAKIAHDTGINVLIDQAHNCKFILMWRFPRELNQCGFRATVTYATLDTVLVPGKSRTRIHVGDAWPYVWFRHPKFNVVILYQNDPTSPGYLPEERELLIQFVREGGGLIVLGTATRDEQTAKQWSLNKLLAVFGAAYGPQTDEDPDSATPRPALRLDESWEVLRKGKRDAPIRARRTFGKGRVVIVEGYDVMYGGKEPEGREQRIALLREIVSWAAQGMPPAGGEPLNYTIYPDQQVTIGPMTIYYTRNQLDEIIRAARQDARDVYDQLFRWYPSPRATDPFVIIACNGGGGGWAVGGRPRTVGVICKDRLAFLSVLGHELAHTMGGPPNTKGELAGIPPIPNSGEAHAGWFQGKINALYRPELRDKPNRDCNRVFVFDKTGCTFDISNVPPGENSKQWTKIWWIWQKLDDRYGPTWYTRWKWVQHMRWMDDPQHKLTWDEMVEDMCIAVGEDLFPFFKKIGTSKVTRDRLPQIEFLGETITLPVAPLEPTPAGHVRIEEIGDYTKPLTPRD